MRLKSDVRDADNVPTEDMIAYLQERIDAIAKRNQDLENENAELRRELNEGWLAHHTDAERRIR